MRCSSGAAAKTEGCRAVCSRAKAETFTDEFKFEGRNVHCANLMCVVKKEGYNRYQTPKKKLDVKFDVELLDLWQLNMLKNQMDIKMWLRMTWTDPSLTLCDCSNHNRAQTGQNLEEHIWTPDLIVEEAVRISRVSPFDFDLRREGDEKRGLRVAMAMELRLTVSCALAELHYPYDQNRCIVRLASHNHGHKEVKFVRVRVSSHNIIYKDLEVNATELCEKEVVDGKDGFKIILRRDGDKMRWRYGFLLSVFVFVTLSVQQPLVWRGPGINDQSGPIVEVMLMAFYILFSVYGKIPPAADQEGVDIVLYSVELGNIIVNLACIWFVLNVIFRRVSLRLHEWYVPNQQNKGRARLAARLKTVQDIINRILIMLIMIFGIGNAVYWKNKIDEAGKQNADTCEK
jgi:hypothetical protein